MSAYRRILAAIDLSEDSRAIIGRALELASPGAASVQLLHVVEFVPVEPMSDSLLPVAQIDAHLIEQARATIVRMAIDLGLAENSAHIEVGSPKTEILRYARSQAHDLIVIGSRERHGLSLLLHHTEGSVLHGAPCDVLAVRVR